jgi:putative copper export protein
LLFVFRTGFNVAALFAIGLALYTALGIVGRPRALLLGSVAAVAGFAALRLFILTAQMGNGAPLIDVTLLPLAWAALGASTASLWTGTAAIAVGAATGWRAALMLGALAIAGGFGLTGHTQALTNPGLAPLAVSLHVLLAGFWIAAPFALWPRPALQNATLHARLERFSAIAVAAVPILIAVGIWLAWTLAKGFSGLTATAYGHLLLLKLGVVSIALVLGALNRQIITTRVLRDPENGRRLLRFSLIGETLLFAIAVLAVSAATTFVGTGE